MKKAKKKISQKCFKFKYRAHEYWLETKFCVGERLVLINYSLKGLDLTGKDFRGADFSFCDFTGCRINYSDFTGANLEKADLSDVNTYGCRFGNANLKGTLIDLEPSYRYMNKYRQTIVSL